MQQRTPSQRTTQYPPAQRGSHRIPNIQFSNVRVRCCPYAIGCYFCMKETSEHVPVHWQQGEFQWWTHCFICWMPASNHGVSHDQGYTFGLVITRSTEDIVSNFEINDPALSDHNSVHIKCDNLGQLCPVQYDSCWCPGCATGYWGLVSLTWFRVECLSGFAHLQGWVLKCHLVLWPISDSCLRVTLCSVDKWV